MRFPSVFRARSPQILDPKRTTTCSERLVSSLHAHRRQLETTQQMVMLQLERIDLILFAGRVRIVEILFVPAFGRDEGVARGVACQSDACLSRFALSFHFICSLTLMVDPTEVRDDDRNWKSDDQHATQTADATDDFARPTNARLRGKVRVENDDVLTRFSGRYLRICKRRKTNSSSSSGVISLLNRNGRKTKRARA